MAEKTPEVGDAVSHDGNWAGHEHDNQDFVITGFKDGGADPADPLRRVGNYLAVFENERYKVNCVTGDLTWFEEDGAWVLPGRLLSKVQRGVFCAMTGAASLPPRGHVAARRILAADAGEV